MSTGSGGDRGRPTVAVVGGGIAGLAAAWELIGGPRAPVPGSPAVVVLEATDRLGGMLRTGTLGGRQIDLGPDGFLGRRPEATQLCIEVGLGDELMGVGASGASVWVRGRRRALPQGLAIGVPTRFWPTVRSGVIGLRGDARLLLDVVDPRPDLRGPLGDRAVGPLVARKLGRRVVERLVDPLLGGIHAGGVGDLSAAATFPQLLQVAQRRSSFMKALRRSMATTGEGDRRSGTLGAPGFFALRDGFESLVDRLAELLERGGTTLRTGSPVLHIDRDPLDPIGERWVLTTPDGTLSADAVVLAVPAVPAADLLEPHDTETAAGLRGIDYASVATVTFSFPKDAVTGDRHGTGLLVPRGSRARLPVGSEPDGSEPEHSQAGAPEPLVVTACTYLSDKWPHLARPGEVLVRASAGRVDDTHWQSLDDRELEARVLNELRVLLDVEGEPTGSLVARFPDALPQYRVHHLLRVAGIEAGVNRLAGVAVAGAAFEGVGVPACIDSGRRAARSVLSGMTARQATPQSP